MFEIEIPQYLINELKQSIKYGPIDEHGRQFIKEHLVAKIDGFKITIHSKEHPPPHFHVTCTEGSGSFNIDDCLCLKESGLKKYFYNIKKWHAKNKAVLIEIWNTSRPSDCPVGTYNS